MGAAFTIVTVAEAVALGSESEVAVSVMVPPAGTSPFARKMAVRAAVAWLRRLAAVGCGAGRCPLDAKAGRVADHGGNHFDDARSANRRRVDGRGRDHHGDLACGRWGGRIVICVLADRVGSATEVAEIVTVLGAGTVAGAV